MKQSQLFGKTRKDISKDEVSTNAQLLERGGFVEKLIAGVYTYLPLGLRVLRKVGDVVREEMDGLGASEIQMPVFSPRAAWEQTKRVESVDVLFEARGANKVSQERNDTTYIINPTHEEVVTPLVGKSINSYKDLPIAVYQIQEKFRNEPRSKSGLLRGREFWMKDLYSFHADEADFQAYYDRVAETYFTIFRRLGLNALKVEASGGVFSDVSHEFQVLTPHGEDTIYVCSACDWAQNKEIFIGSAGDACPKCEGSIEEQKSIEVGNIFPLATKFSDAFDLKFVDEQSVAHPVIMGCYGIGISRAVGAIAEVCHDEKGIIWPEAVAPFQVHLISIRSDEAAADLYRELTNAGLEVLWDDRDISPGQKFADSDLIGIPVRLVVSEKTLATDCIEWKRRDSEKTELVKRSVLLQKLQIQP